MKALFQDALVAPKTQVALVKEQLAEGEKILLAEFLATAEEHGGKFFRSFAIYSKIFDVMVQENIPRSKIESDLRRHGVRAYYDGPVAYSLDQQSEGTLISTWLDYNADEVFLDKRQIGLILEATAKIGSGFSLVDRARSVTSQRHFCAVKARTLKTALGLS